MQNLSRYSLIVLFITGLVGIRAFEDSLFYDPFLEFFKAEYLIKDAPEFNTLKLLFNTSLRYVLNGALSLAIIFFVFRNKDIFKLSGVLYLIFYVVLIFLFLILVTHAKQQHYFYLFNIRRFLIQPIFLLLLLPAFYFHLKNEKQKM